jgi:hypothetical protein
MRSHPSYRDQRDPVAAQHQLGAEPVHRRGPTHTALSVQHGQGRGQPWTIPGGAPLDTFQSNHGPGQAGVQRRGSSGMHERAGRAPQ